MTSLAVIKPRIQEICTLTEVKNYLRVDFNDDDMLIEMLIKAAQNHVETHLNRTLLKQSYKMIWHLDKHKDTQYLEYFKVALPMGPVMSVDKVFDLDRQENLKRVSWDLNNPTPYIMFAKRHENVEIHYTAGYGETRDSVPGDIRQSILLIVAEMYRNRDALTPTSLHKKLGDLLGCYISRRLG